MGKETPPQNPNILPKAQNEKSEIKPKPEQQEKIKILISGSGPVGKSLNLVLGFLAPVDAVSLVPEVELLNQTIENQKNDAIIVYETGNAEDIVRQITKIRNNPKIKDQPVIIALNVRNSTRNFNDIMNAGADIGIPMIGQMLPQLLVGIHSVPEMIGRIEDMYGEKMLTNKKGFYKEYSDKLAARSEITADLPQELKILQDIFKKNNCHKILDAGGGEGRIAIPLANNGFKITNLDSSKDLIARMKEKTDQVEGVAADLKDQPFKEDTFDAVTFNWHVFCDILGNKAKRKVIAEAFRVLKEGGVIALDIPDLLIYEKYRELTKEFEENALPEFKGIDNIKKEKKKWEGFLKLNLDPLNEAMALQSINYYAYMLGERMYFEPEIEDLEEEHIKKGWEKLQYEKVSFEKDGIYVDYPGGKSVFIGYVPTEEEMKKYLKEAGFTDIEAIHWKTKKGFYKLTLTGKKKTPKEK